MRSSKPTGPALSPKTWYGMPAYAKDGNVVCFFQSAQKFKTRYATLGFSDKANLDDGRHVADRFRAEGDDRYRGGNDRGAREESGELRIRSPLVGVSSRIVVRLLPKKFGTASGLPVAQSL